MALIVIGPNTIINSNTLYNGDTLDMTGGNFIVTNGATLAINGCTINGVLSALNPTLIDILNGHLAMTASNVDVKAPTVIPHPAQQSLYYFARLERGNCGLFNCDFIIDDIFAAGFFLSTIGNPTTNLNFSNNKFTNWHGTLYLLNTSNSIIDNNRFLLCSYGNILVQGNQNFIRKNVLLLSGRDELGNAIDVLFSNDIHVSENNIAIPTCRGILVGASSNIMIDHNLVTGGITYGIRIVDTGSEQIREDSYAFDLVKELEAADTHDVTVDSNVLTQNRFGLSAVNVDKLTVINNLFSQRFIDAAQRKFWTDNAVLLNPVTNLVWNGNLYKEAFSQDNAGDNSHTQLVVFPATGGVVI